VRSVCGWSFEVSVLVGEETPGVDKSDSDNGGSDQVNNGHGLQSCCLVAKVLVLAEAAVYFQRLRCVYAFPATRKTVRSTSADHCNNNNNHTRQ